jgi:hypothetical protein
MLFKRFVRTIREYQRENPGTVHALAFIGYAVFAIGLYKRQVKGLEDNLEVVKKNLKDNLIEDNLKKNLEDNLEVAKKNLMEVRQKNVEALAMADEEYLRLVSRVYTPEEYEAAVKNMLDKKKR